MKAKKVLMSLALVVLAVGSISAGDYTVSKSQSSVKWLAKKVTGQHDGTIAFSSGFLNVSNGKPSGGEFIIDMNSIVCTDITDAEWNQKLIGHLKSDDFFSVAKYSTSKLVIKSVESKGGSKYLFKGDLSIKGKTHPTEFEATVSMSGNTASAEGKIVVDRTLYDVRYGSGKFFDNLGDKTIYDDFTLDFKVVANK